MSPVVFSVSLRQEKAWVFFSGIVSVDEYYQSIFTMPVLNFLACSFDSEFLFLTKLSVKCIHVNFSFKLRKTGCFLCLCIDLAI